MQRINLSNNRKSVAPPGKIKGTFRILRIIFFYKPLRSFCLQKYEPKGFLKEVANVKDWKPPMQNHLFQEDDQNISRSLLPPLVTVQVTMIPPATAFKPYCQKLFNVSQSETIDQALN